MRAYRHGVCLFAPGEPKNRAVDLNPSEGKPLARDCLRSCVPYGVEYWIVRREQTPNTLISEVIIQVCSLFLRTTVLLGGLFTLPGLRSPALYTAAPYSLRREQTPNTLISKVILQVCRLFHCTTVLLGGLFTLPGLRRKIFVSAREESSIRCRLLMLSQECPGQVFSLPGSHLSWKPTVSPHSHALQ